MGRRSGGKPPQSIRLGGGAPARAARKRVPAAEARAGMKDLVDAVKDGNERIKITRYGKTVAYLVPARDGEALEVCAEELAECLRKKENGADKATVNPRVRARSRAPAKAPAE